MAHNIRGLIDPFTENELKTIFKLKEGNCLILSSRENNRLEFRETYSYNGCVDKLRTFAGFANNQGGYFVFGVKDRPRELLGLHNRNFTDLEVEKLTNLLNEHFSPEVHWSPHEYDFQGKTFGLIYVEESLDKPVICTNNIGKCKQGEIYYRYRGRTETVKYPELKMIMESIRENERNLWMKHLNRLASVGVRNAAVLDSKTGKVTGSTGSFLIDESLLPHISFIHEGHFQETDSTPALKLVGEVEIIDSYLVQPTRQIVKRTIGINAPDIVNAFLSQESVQDPREYISALCFQTSAKWPVYYFIVQAGLTRNEVINLIESSKSTSAAKKNLLKRIKKQIPYKETNRPCAVELKQYQAKISANSIDISVNKETVKNVLVTILTLKSSEIDKEYLFPVLRAWFEQYGDDTDLKTTFRIVFEYLDIVLFAGLVKLE